MAKTPSDDTVLLRMAIQEVLDAAKEPMTGADVASAPQVASLALDSSVVSRQLAQMYKMQKKDVPLSRIRAAAGRSQYAYFNPKVVKLDYPQAERREAPRREEDAVNGANSDFTFDPVEFSTEAPPAPAEASVSLPAGVRSITLTVSGVTVRIELA